jgi:formate hydrogenlyase subunit 3/multisubunit Na+/H+ antiporter MnhD subunit
MLGLAIIGMGAAGTGLPTKRTGSLPVVLITAGAALLALCGLLAVRDAIPLELQVPWTFPIGRLILRLDALSGLFLALIGTLGALTSVYGLKYLAHERRAARQRWAWIGQALLIASMAAVVTAADAVVFLMAWELMAISSFALVVLDDGTADTRQAGWVYLAACHLGAACLIALFLLLGLHAGSTAFADIRAAGIPATLAPWVWGLAILGFGSKAGLVPLHVWLPAAHPAAPSHVSALMSGVMIKMGIYGLLRLTLLLGAPPVSAAWALVVLGALSGVMGAVNAVAQDDLKRLLAYSSVENIGLIGMGLGLGWIGAALQQPGVAAAGYAAALVHVVHHALGKGALFMAAGSVVHATGTRSLDRLGGLIRPMPQTGAMLAMGAGILSGLPPWLGFISEFLLLTAAFRAVAMPWHQHLVAPLLVVAAVALTATLATVAFVKAFGTAFLGQPRQPLTQQPHDPPPAMGGAVAILLAASTLLMITAPQWLLPLSRVMAGMPGLTGDQALVAVQQAVTTLRPVQLVSALLLLAILALAAVRRLLLRQRPVSAGPTWGCGYGRPTARMQHTGFAFSQPVAALFGRLSGQTQRLHLAEGLFPTAADLTVTTSDLWRDHLFTPLFRGVAQGLAPLRRLQHGNTHLYVLYIAVTLIAATAWGLWP